MDPSSFSVKETIQRMREKGFLPANDRPEPDPAVAREPESEQTVKVAGNVVRLHRMRSPCQDAGHCLGLTRETNCNLYPARSGWCRERI